MYFLYFILKAKIKKNIEIERVATLYSVKQPALLEDDIKAITGNPNSAVPLPYLQSKLLCDVTAPPKTEPEI